MKNKNTLNIILIILAVLVLITGVILGFLFYQTRAKRNQVSTFEECIKAGNPVAESYPRQCRMPDDKLFIEETSLINGIQEYTSPKGEVIKISSPKAWDNLSSPLEITGEVRGDWSFEGDFPVVLTNWDGLIIAEGIATLEGEWMTSNYVPFKVNLTFEKPTLSERGSLILKKDNPSDLRQLDDAVEIPVSFEMR